jgi:hypothetical protein
MVTNVQVFFPLLKMNDNAAEASVAVRPLHCSLRLEDICYLGVRTCQVTVHVFAFCLSIASPLCLRTKRRGENSDVE